MTSSDSFELCIRQDGQAATVGGSLLAPGATAAFALAVRTARRVELSLEVAFHDQLLEVRSGTRLLAVLARGRRRVDCDITADLADLHGEAALEVVQLPAGSAADEEGEEVVLLTALLALDAPAETQTLFDALLADVAAVHVGLAHDVLGAAVRRMTWVARSRLFEPAAEHARLTDLLGRLEVALRTIGSQPSMCLERVRSRARWRSGDRLDTSAVEKLTRLGELTMDRGRVAALGVLDARRPRLTLDLPEHRHLRAGIGTLARRSVRLRDGCRYASSLLGGEEARWGGRRPDSESVFEQRYAPRIRKLDAWAAAGETLAGRYRRLLDDHPFLKEAGEARTVLQPTPLFLNRPGYREAYEVIRDAGREHGLAVDTAGLRVRLRDLDTLYEYWVFIRTVALVRELLGAPSTEGWIRLSDEVYRPELAPGQRITWSTADGGRLHVVYEPSIPPLAWRRAAAWDWPWRASLVRAPLRPDVLLVREEPGEPPHALVFDAKNSTGFRRDSLWAYSDYRTLIHDPASGRQPVKWMFFLHRTPSEEHCTYPGFFAGQPVPRTTSVLGSAAFLPEQTERVVAILRRFLE